VLFLASFLNKSGSHKKVIASEAKPFGLELTAERQSHVFTPLAEGHGFSRG